MIFARQKRPDVPPEECAAVMRGDRFSRADFRAQITAIGYIMPPCLLPSISHIICTCRRHLLLLMMRAHDAEILMAAARGRDICRAMPLYAIAAAHAMRYIYCAPRCYDAASCA